MSDLEVSKSVVIPGRELEWTAVRASGPGGQNVNKVSSKVELRFDFEESEVLTASIKLRLRKLAATKLDQNGRILIVSQVTRNQPQNLADARRRLADLVSKALVVPKVRRPTRPSKASKARRVEGKRANAQRKQNRARKSDD